MESSRGTGRKKGIVVDPSTFELEAEWGPVSRWTQVFAWVLTRSRQPVALVSILAILLIALKLTGVGAADALIPSIAIIAIAAIAIAAIFSERSSKRHGQSGEREATSQYAAED